MSKYKKIKNRTRVKYLNTTYVVDKNTVSCDLYFTIQFSKTRSMNFVLPRIVNICTKYNIVGDNSYIDEDENIIFQPVFKYSASATCHKSDKFNFDVGKRLAQTKAQAKAFNVAHKVYDEIRDIVLRINEEVSELMDNCNIAYNNCLDHVDELSD